MKYSIIAAIIIFATSIRTLSFALWQFRNKNVVGGVMVGLLGLTAIVMSFFQF